MVNFEVNLASKELEVGQDQTARGLARSMIPGSELAHERFEEVAARQPNAVAAAFQGHLLTYGELSERSSKLAHWLMANGVRPNTTVGVCVKPSPEILIALLAIWKAGGIYFPIDPTYPELLVRGMLQEVAPAAVLTTSNLGPPLQNHTRFCFDSDWQSVQELPDVAPNGAASSEDGAYLIYTSGTTGKPKGVVATHGNLVHYIGSANATYGFQPGDVFSSLARYTFSISLFELLSPLCCGGQVLLFDRNDVLAPERLLAALDAVTVMHAGPSLLGSLFRHIRASRRNDVTFPRMRHASSGGDIVSPWIMEGLKQYFPNAELYVIYGCTEIGCMGTTFPIHREGRIEHAFIGKPFANVTLRVLDEKHQTVAPGEVGEIAIAGNGVARGYFERPQLTLERFVDLEGRRFYLTGDMARIHSDGNAEILGRHDFQVQIRGIRVELVGIESTILDLKLATQCAVLAAPGDDGEARLFAFVVNPNVADSTTFRRLLGDCVPDYMVPHYVVELDALPQTANGKLDRKRLLSIDWQKHLMPSGPASRHMPGSALESAIAGVFAHVLQRSDFGVNDNFFDLGGDSLLAVITLEAIAKAAGVVIAPQVLFEHGTVRELARRSLNGSSEQSRPVLLNGDGRHPALFMLSGHHIYRQLANRLRGCWSAYGVFAPFELATLDSLEPEERSVEQLAKDYWAIIRSHQAAGPYCLLGYSFAGIVAFELARQIQNSGETVGYLALVDAVLPEWALGWRYRLRQLDRVLRTSPRHVLEFLMRRVNVALGRVPKEDFLRYAGDDRLGPLEYRREALNATAAARYLSSIRPFAGSGRLIVSGERLRKDPLKSPNCGWAQYIPHLEIAQIETDHFRMMSDEPYVTQLGDILAHDLNNWRSATTHGNSLRSAFK